MKLSTRRLLLSRPYSKFRKAYELVERIGEGAFGAIFKVNVRRAKFKAQRAGKFLRIKIADANDSVQDGECYFFIDRPDTLRTRLHRQGARLLELKTCLRW